MSCEKWWTKYRFSHTNVASWYYQIFLFTNVSTNELS